MKQTWMSIYVPSMNVEIGTSERLLGARDTGSQSIMSGLLKNGVDCEMENFYATANALIRMAIERYDGKNVQLSSSDAKQPSDFGTERHWVPCVDVRIYELESGNDSGDET